MYSIGRIAAAVAVGFLGCLFIWAVTPYNNFFLQNSFISDTYFPVAGVVYMLVLLVCVNPLLNLLGRRFVLNRRQLALVFAMLLAAAILPSQGLLRMLPWSLAGSNRQINQSERYSDAFEQTQVPHVIFPDEVGYGIDTPVSDQLLDELNPGEAIPWENWLPVLGVWGVFLLACWLLMVGTGLVLFPEWKNRERLQFPLLDVYRSLLPEVDSHGILPPVFRDRMFWFGAGVVMVLYATNGLAHHTHGGFPAIPLGWRLSAVFSESPWRYLNGAVKNVNHIYFVLVGMAFFMSSRVSFSIWFITIAYYLYDMIQRAYIPGYYGGMINDHRNGAMIAVSIMVLYLSRRHWLHVGRLMFSGPRSEDDRLLKSAGWMVASGAVGMFIWLNWAGVSPLLAALFVFIGFMVSLLIARIVAETGMPFVRITGLNPMYFMAMLPAGWLGGAAVYMAGFVSMVFPMGSRVSAAVMTIHAVGLDAKGTAREQRRIGYMVIAILGVGLVICGAIHLYMGYTQPFTMDGSFSRVNAWGSQRMFASANELMRWTQDAWPYPSHRLGNLTFGIILAGALQFACMTSPTWPIHPIGMLLVGHYYGNLAWASVLIGWLLKRLIIYCGGATAYRRAKPLFMGLIMGEIFSAIIWTAVPVILLLLGRDPADVGHIPMLPT